MEKNSTDAQVSAAVSDTTQKDDSSFLASFSLEEEKAIIRKVDKRFLILIGFIYLFKNIDYTNASNAKVLQKGQPSNIMIELGMTADQYNWVQTIYYISYIIFEAPFNLLLKKVTPRYWQSRIMLSWGLVLACHGAVQSRTGLYIARFFLGLAEASMFPAIIAQLCGWYRSDEIGKPVAFFFGFQNCSGIFGSLLAYGISYMNGVRGLSAWRWLFIIEGVVTILFSGVVYYVLPDWPESERSKTWLTEREQRFLSARLTENAPRNSDKNFDREEILRVLKNPQTYGFMIAQIFINLAGYALSWYLPTIITNLGFAGLPRNQLLVIPPSFCSVLLIAVSGYVLSKGWIQRSHMCILYTILAISGYATFVATRSNGGVYAACVIATMFYSAFFIPFWAWRSGSLKNATGATFGLAFQSSLGQIGGAIGPQLFQEKYAYNGYRTSFIICLVAILASLVASLITLALTYRLEQDTQRVHKLRLEAKRKGEIYSGDDVNYVIDNGFVLRKFV